MLSHKHLITRNRISQVSNSRGKNHSNRHAAVLVCSAAVIAISAIFGAVATDASTINWSSTAGTAGWETATNWSSDTVPGVADVAAFDSTSYTNQPILGSDIPNSNASVSGLAFGDGTTAAAALTIAASTSSEATSGTTLSGSSTINLAAIGTQNVGEELAGTGIVSGTVITGITGSQVTISSPTTAVINSGTSLTFSPTLTIGSSGVTVSGSTSNSSLTTVQIISAPVVLGTSQAWENNSISSTNALIAENVFIGANQTLTLNAVTKGFNNPAFEFDGQNSISGAGTLKISSGVAELGATSSGAAGNPGFTGNIVVEAGGTVVAYGSGNGSGSSVDLLGTGTLIINGGTIGFNGNLNGTSNSHGLLGGTEVWNADFATNNYGKTVYMGTGAISLGTVAGGSAVRTITSGNNFGGGNTVFGGAISNGVTATGLNITGPGIVTLDGANTYTGPTTVSKDSQGAGKLVVNGSLENSNITIVAGGTLEGTGTLNWNLAGNTGNLITAAGTLNITSLNLALNITGTQTLSQYVVADYSGGTLTGTAFASVTGLPAGWSINYNDGSEIVLNVAPVPEPAALGLMAGAGAGILLVGRKRKRA